MRNVHNTWWLLILILSIFLTGCTKNTEATAQTNESVLLDGGTLPDGGRVFSKDSPEAREALRGAGQKIGETIDLRKGNITVEVLRTR